MNILIIDNSLAFTGAFKCALNEAELLSGQHRFIFILHEQSKLTKILQDKGIQTYTIPMVEIKRSIPVLLLYPLILLRNTIILRRIVRNEKVDVVQVNDFYNMLGIMLKISGYKGKLLTYVRFLPSVMPALLRNTWIKYGLKYSDRMIGVSDAVLKQLPGNIKAIRLYDPVQLAENLPEKRYVQQETVSLLYLANYIKGKGQDDAVEAFVKAYQTNNRLRLTFMGGDMGLDKNKEFKQSLEQRIIEAGLEDVVTFAPFNSDVEAAIKAADIILNFSEAESFSMTCLEAAYYGTALIATRCGGPEEIIENGQTGVTVPVKDIDAMAAAITKLASDTNLRSMYATAGRAYVLNKFSITEYKKAMQQVITG